MPHGSGSKVLNICAFCNQHYLTTGTFNLIQKSGHKLFNSSQKTTGLIDSVNKGFYLDFVYHFHLSNVLIKNL